MKKSKRGGKGHSAAGRTRAFRLGALACALLGAGVATAVASYESPAAEPARTVEAVAPAQPRGGYVTVEVGGRRLQVNAQTLQQGPLTQEQSQQLADALKDNKSTEGLVEVRHEDGTVSLDLQDRFRNVTLARKNDDGTVTTACVDSPEAAKSFLNGGETRPTNGPTNPGKAAVKE